MRKGETGDSHKEKAVGFQIHIKGNVKVWILCFHNRGCYQSILIIIILPREMTDEVKDRYVYELQILL